MSIYPECSAWHHLFAYRGLGLLDIEGHFHKELFCEQLQDSRSMVALTQIPFEWHQSEGLRPFGESA